MTHQELLAKIEIRIADFCEGEEEFCDICSPWKALSAVVELHKSNQVDNAIWCSECSKRFENSGYYENYPCPTIQAIEKELA